MRPPATSASTGPEGHRSVAGSDARPAGGGFDQTTHNRAMGRGYGDAMGRGLELALTLVVVGGLGWIIDRVVGTYPLFTVIFSVAGFAGITVKLWLGYDLEMRKLDQDGIWSQAITAEAVPAAGQPAEGTPVADRPDQRGDGR